MMYIMMHIKQKYNNKTVLHIHIRNYHNFIYRAVKYH